VLVFEFYDAFLKGYLVVVLMADSASLVQIVLVPSIEHSQLSLGRVVMDLWQGSGHSVFLSPYRSNLSMQVMKADNLVFSTLSGKQKEILVEGCHLMFDW
jgi:hypothetical protein